MWQIAAGLGAAQLLGGALGAEASKSAANTQAAATQAGVAETQRQFNLTRQDTAPYRATGRSALYALRDMMGLPNLENAPTGAPAMPSRDQFTSQRTTQEVFRDPNMIGGGNSIRSVTNPYFDQSGYDQAMTGYQDALQRWQGAQTPGSVTPSDFTKSPDYQFRLNEGLKALDRGAAARGSYLSGATMKGLQEYGQQSASQEFQNRFSRLSGLAGLGGNMTQTQGALGQQNAASVADLLGSGAAARAAGTVGAANAWGGALSGVGNTISQMYMLNRMFPQGASTAGGI